MLSHRFRHSLSADQLILKILSWASPDQPACLLDNNGQHQFGYPNSRALIGVGAIREIKLPYDDHPWETLQKEIDNHPGWWMGYLGYDLKNASEDLFSSNPDHLQAPDLYFFQPAHIFVVTQKFLTVYTYTSTPESVWSAISQVAMVPSLSFSTPEIHARITPEAYIEKIHQIKAHIKRGDIYEMNFCQEFYATDTYIPPLSLFKALKEKSPSPFSAYLQSGHHYMLCASPERFLRKRNDVLISQPIKGTRSRGLTPQEDEALKRDLMNSQKDRSEHVMIVDLVRNDLARSSLTGSVQVSELYGIYSFAQVHQMISTIQSRLRPDIPLVEAIRNAFPMGSMTGAPKIKAMELIDQLESTKRSIYSGAIGYISPEGDFDFNVVIRTLFLRQDVGYLSFSVGGAIVYDSDPEQEYQECMWKAKAILETLGQQPSDIIYQDKGSVTP